jgi:hypothetical protein
VAAEAALEELSSSLRSEIGPTDDVPCFDEAAPTDAISSRYRVDDTMMNSQGFDSEFPSDYVYLL